MHYYRFNIADYRKRTGHLTLIEHAIYRALIDTYYLEETPLTSDLDALMRSHSVRSKVEKEAFSAVLKEFFCYNQNGYTNIKCDEELAQIYEKSEKARASAKARWDKKTSKPMRDECERIANGMLPNTQYLTPNTKEEKEVIQWKKIQELFNEILGDSLGGIRGITGERKKHISARIKEDSDKRSSVDWWGQYFSLVNESDHLTGRGHAWDKTGKPWKASFDWLITENHMIKILENKYNG